MASERDGMRANYGGVTPLRWVAIATSNQARAMEDSLRCTVDYSKNDHHFRDDNGICSNLTGQIL